MISILHEAICKTLEAYYHFQKITVTHKETPSLNDMIKMGSTKQALNKQLKKEES